MRQATAPAVLRDWQRATLDARAMICAELDRLTAIMSAEKAICHLIGAAAAGTLAPELQQAVPVANARGGDLGHRQLSRSTLYRWLAARREGNAALAPKPTEPVRIPAWAPHLLQVYQRPQKPSLAFAVAQLPKTLPAGVTAPSYHAAYRFLERMGVIERHAGRVLPRELSKQRPFVRRDASELDPCDVYTADGHTFDAEIAHPAHGRPFRPEITSVVDVHTRKLVGWSVGLAESTRTVVDAWRHAVESHGINAIFYVDRGAGFRNEAMGNEATGFAARLGATITHSLPYRSQARGTMERSHQSVWVRLAKTLATYIGADMDPEAKQRVFRITRRDVKAAGASPLLCAWPRFVELCAAAVDEYNATPHTALPKLRENDGRLRHLTPNEAWAAAQQRGWEAHHVGPAEAADLFRPYVERIARRGEVEVFGNQYFSADLEQWHGEKVRVGYDLHNADRVWVRNLDGQLITIAEFEANKRAYFPQPFVERAREKRAEGRARRLEERLEEVRQELDPPALIEHQAAAELPPIAVPVEDDEFVTNVVEIPARRPAFMHDYGKYEWLLEHADQVDDDDRRWIEWYRTTGEWRDLYGGEVFKVAAR
ncbi:MAG: transposase [Burkholderiales bacterium]|nr:transposase [Burkholderiales bacterium]